MASISQFTSGGPVRVTLTRPNGETIDLNNAVVEAMVNYSEFGGPSIDVTIRARLPYIRGNTGESSWIEGIEPDPTPYFVTQRTVRVQWEHRASNPVRFEDTNPYLTSSNSPRTDVICAHCLSYVSERSTVCDKCGKDLA